MLVVYNVIGLGMFYFPCSNAVKQFLDAQVNFFLKKLDYL